MYRNLCQAKFRYALPACIEIDRFRYPLRTAAIGLCFPIMNDYDRPVAWIDYIIASDDPADKAMITEYNARSWAYGQTNQALHRIGFTEDSFARLAEEQRLSKELQARIHARAVELMEAGKPRRPRNRYRHGEPFGSRSHRISTPGIPRSTKLSSPTLRRLLPLRQPWPRLLRLRYHPPARQ